MKPVQRIFDDILIGHVTKKATSLTAPVARLKFPPIVQMAYSPTRSKDWDDILTAHKQETIARTWTMRDKKLGKWIFNPNDAGTIKEKEKRKKKVFLGSVRVCILV